MTALTGETGAGKTMLVEAIELLLGGHCRRRGRAHGADEARVEGRFVVGDDEIVLARVVPADGRSRAYVDGRLATAATLAEDRRARWSTSTASTPTRACCRRRRSAPPSTASPASTSGRCDAARRRRSRHRRPARRPRRRRPRPGPGDRPAALPGGRARTGRRSTTPTRTTRSTPRRTCSPTPRPTARRPRRPTPRSTDDGGRPRRRRHGAGGHRRAGRRSRSSRSACAASPPSSPTSAPRSADVAERIDDDPDRLDAVRQRRQLLRELRRKYGDTLAEVMAHRDEAAARLAELEGYEERAAALEAERAAAVRRRGRGRRRRSAERRRAAAPRLGEGGRAPPPAAGDAARPRRGRRRRRRSRRRRAVPARRQPRRADAPAGARSPPAASWPGPCSRSAARARPRRPDTLVFDEVDAGIGGEAALAVGRSLAALGAPPPGARRHPPAPGGRLRRPPGGRRARPSVRGRTVARAAAVDGDDRTRGAVAHAVGHARQRRRSPPRRGAARRRPRRDGGPALMAIREPRRSTEVVGRCRVDRRTKDLVQRLQPGEIAVIDHADLDRVAAEALVEAGVGGRRQRRRRRSPAATRTSGPLLIAAAGIPLVDDVGSHVLDVLVEGEVVTIDGDRGHRGRRRRRPRRRQQTVASIEEQIARGPQQRRRRARALRQQHARVPEARARTSPPTSPSCPTCPVSFKGRQALVVVARLRLPRGPRRAEALRLHPGAEARCSSASTAAPTRCCELGLTPDIIIGDFDSVSATRAALRAPSWSCTPTPTGDAPGAARLEDARPPYERFEARRHQRGHRPAARLRDGAPS